MAGLNIILVSFSHMFCVCSEKGLMLFYPSSRHQFIVEGIIMAVLCMCFFHLHLLFLFLLLLALYFNSFLASNYLW